MDKKLKIILSISIILIITLIIYICVPNNKKNVSNEINNTNESEKLIQENTESEKNDEQKVIEKIDEKNESKEDIRIKYNEAINYEEIKPNIEVEVSNVWRDFEMAINGKKFQVPCNFSDFLEISDFTISEDEKKANIKPGESKKILLYKNNVLVATAVYTNVSNEEKSCLECELTSIEQSCFNNIIEPESVIIFPGNLHIGNSGKTLDIIEKIGEYCDVYDEGDIFRESKEKGIPYIPEDYVKYTYREKNDKTGNKKIEVVVSNGIIIQLLLKNINN